ncbi:hypothetical protein [Aureivirga sp. CE67]|uniref:hypothetical protein n=1 Tax=Aureivirga sp. CE67 TaxID=1788983 RepID=UPI0018C8EA39|nr:hypothetical protein [Aureivirga sp. CE67]
MKKEFEKKTKKWKKKIILDISKSLLFFLIAPYFLINYEEGFGKIGLILTFSFYFFWLIREATYKNLYILKIINEEDKFTFIYYSFFKGIQELIVLKEDLHEVFYRNNEFTIKHQVNIVSWKTIFLIDAPSTTDLIYSNIRDFEKNVAQILGENTEIVKDRKSFKKKIKKEKIRPNIISFIVISIGFVYFYFFNEFAPKIVILFIYISLLLIRFWSDYKDVYIYDIEITDDEFKFISYSFRKGIHEIDIEKSNFLEADFKKITNFRIKHNVNDIYEFEEFIINFPPYNSIYQKIQGLKIETDLLKEEKIDSED